MLCPVSDISDSNLVSIHFITQNRMHVYVALKRAVSYWLCQYMNMLNNQVELSDFRSNERLPYLFSDPILLKKKKKNKNNFFTCKR